jgi:probable F420-dependent oxidoreductase
VDAEVSDATDVKFGLAVRNFAPGGEPLDISEVVGYSRLAEERGLDSLWAWDHILLGSKRPFAFLESLSVLAGLALTTRTVALGTGVLVLPLRNPVVLAKVTATIDRMSGGRLVLGVAAGWYRREFEACGVPFERRGAVFMRNVQILRRLWTEERVDGSEDGMEFRNAVMLPRPIQDPRPPLLFGGYVDRVLRRVAAEADGWLTYFYTPDSFRRSWAKIGNYAQESGRDPAELQNVAQLPICVDATFEKANGRVKAFIQRYFDVAPWSESTADSAIRGTAEQCAAQLAEHVEAGVQHVVLVPCDYDPEQVEAIATGILPAFRTRRQASVP